MMREKKGMWFELGTPVCLGVSCTTTGLRWGDFLTLAAGRSISNVIPGVLCLVVHWCVCSGIWTTVDAVGFVVVVASGAGPGL